MCSWAVVALSQYLAGRLEVVCSDDDLLRSDSRDPFECTGALVGQPVRALDTGASQQPAEQLGLRWVRYDVDDGQFVHDGSNLREKLLTKIGPRGTAREWGGRR